MVDAKTEGWIEIAQRGFENWKAKPHNARWFRKIDGTPIPNDLTICIGEAFAEPLRSLSLAGEDAAGLCERLEKRAAFWERYWTGRSLQDPDSGPIREAAAMIRSLSLRVEAEKRAREEAQSYGGEARIRENAERAKFEEMRGRAEAAETHSAELAKVLENILDTYRRVYYMPKPGDGKLMWETIDEARSLLASRRTQIHNKKL